MAPHHIAVPVGNILVGDTRGHVEHDDRTLTLDVVAVSQATELFLRASERRGSVRERVPPSPLRRRPAGHTHTRAMAALRKRESGPRVCGDESGPEGRRERERERVCGLKEERERGWRPEEERERVDPRKEERQSSGSPAGTAPLSLSLSHLALVCVPVRRCPRR